MRVDQQLDIIRHSDKEKARAARIAAEVALHDPHWTDAERKRRHEHYKRMAELYGGGDEVRRTAG